MEQETQPRKTTHRVPFGLIVVAVFVVAGLAACGTTNGATSSMATSTAGGSAKSLVVSTVENSQFGNILVSGKTLYTLEPSSSPCTSECMKIWPELVLPKGVTKATAGIGVSASNLGTVNRGGGVLQVTYAGKALYLFSGDAGAGQVNGNVTDAWGKWSVVVTANPADNSAPATPGATTIPNTSPPAGSSSTSGKSTAPTTTPPSPTTTTPPSPTTTTPPSPTTTAPGGSGGAGF